MITAQIQALDAAITEWQATADAHSDGPYKTGVLEAIDKLRAQREVLATAEAEPTRAEVIEQQAQALADQMEIQARAQQIVEGRA